MTETQQKTESHEPVQLTLADVSGATKTTQRIADAVRGGEGDLVMQNPFHPLDSSPNNERFVRNCFKGMRKAAHLATLAIANGRNRGVEPTAEDIVAQLYLNANMMAYALDPDDPDYVFPEDVSGAMDGSTVSSQTR